ncbi:hypothetical protein [Burkholderia multivorans]|uniref:hypothetical protein n=1 Tax=Burkholderia multivorans TaxID=87883 RepID=UPI0021C0B9EB|nr:hypothetical protein [Burkholderia multivorans]MDR8763310.1 hypothetical protein [Burkholderia multivorans]MDR8769005.1 hypothetical protein [Burkholderia multivorans]MDR8774919.1 hypothetical protein [Burkholderia multivorans]MDR8792531.1 hypothetical protein [Burkholderia multivorans]MDR8798610.1 hypothetical protein [Burkholderia multivorans]
MTPLPDDIETAPGLYMVGYTLDYAHRVVVGVRAASADEACSLARAAFDAGTLWDDTPDVPLLYDDYEELDGQTLRFDATAVVAWPVEHASARMSRVHGAAERLLALVQLVDSRLPAASAIEAWHPEVLVSMTITAGQVRELRALLAMLAHC